MPRLNSSDWSVNDDVAAARLQDLNQEIDDLFAYGSDRGRVRTAASLTALKIDIAAFNWKIGEVNGQYAGGTDISVVDDSTNYVEVDAANAIQINQAGWTANYARLGTVTTSGGAITAISVWRTDVIGGPIGVSNLVNVETLTGNKSISSTSERSQILNADGTDRDVTLATTNMEEGDYFYITNGGTTGDLAVKQSSTLKATLYPGQSCRAVYDGTNWYATLLDVDIRFGNGSDGVLTGTQTIDCGNSHFVVKQYTSLNITAGQTVDFSNVPDDGALVVFLCQGNIVLAGTIDGDGDGSLGGAGVSATGGPGTDFNQSTQGNAATEPFNNLTQTRGGAAGGASTGAYSATTTAGAAPSNSTALTIALLQAILPNGIAVAPGGGGGSGGAAVKAQEMGANSAATVTSLDGGRGGLGLLIICGGTANVTDGTVTIDGVAAEGISTESHTFNSSANGGAACSVSGSAGGAAGTGALLSRGAITGALTVSVTGGAHSDGVGAAAGWGSGAGAAYSKQNGVDGIAGSFIVAQLVY